MIIGLTADKEYSIGHDLNFGQLRYESKHVIVSFIESTNFATRLRFQTFKNPKPALMAALRETGPVPGDENGVKSKRSAAGEEGSKKKKRTDKSVSLS